MDKSRLPFLQFSGYHCNADNFFNLNFHCSHAVLSSPAVLMYDKKWKFYVLTFNKILKLAEKCTSFKLDPIELLPCHRFVEECKHYYSGFKLLFLDVRVSSKIIWKVLNGHTLSRRENRYKLYFFTSNFYLEIFFLVLLGFLSRFISSQNWGKFVLSEDFF